MLEGKALPLKERVALVAGASRGIGAAIAEGFAEAGAIVIGISRSGGVQQRGITHKRCDLTDSAALFRLLQEISADVPKVDILVNAAAISLPAGETAEERLAHFRETLDVDVIGAYAMVLAALSLLKAANSASVINITSINSVRGFPGNPGYVVSKSALSGMTRALAVDLAADNIRVNAIAPGYVRTAMTEKSFSDPVLHEQRRKHTLLGRWGNPEDVVGAAVFLASDASSYITGQELFVDGGWTANGLVNI